MTILLNHTNNNGLVSDGHLSIDGEPVCDTTESAKTLLAPGAYQVRIFKCLRSKRLVPIIISQQHPDLQEPTPKECRQCATAELSRISIRQEEYRKLEQSGFGPDDRADIIAFEQSVEAETRQRLQALTAHNCQHCPRLLCGNGAYHRHDGTILVGRSLLPGIVTESHTTFDRLYHRIEKAQSRGTEIELVVR